jgi:5-methylcytosine-specific restriction endonuclease McrA
MPWGQGSTRASRKARYTCLNDAGHTCQLNYPGCMGEATIADHIINIASTGQTRAQATNPDDLQAVCASCHDIKTQAERSAGTQRPGKRRPRPHPSDAL